MSDKQQPRMVPGRLEYLTYEDYCLSFTNFYLQPTMTRVEWESVRTSNRVWGFIMAPGGLVVDGIANFMRNTGNGKYLNQLEGVGVLAGGVISGLFWGAVTVYVIKAVKNA